MKSFIKKLPLISNLLGKFDYLHARIDFVVQKLDSLHNAIYSVNSGLSEEIKNYHVYKHFKLIRSLCVVKDVADMKYIRVGRDHDGGYVMANCFAADSIAYSFGISNDVSWDMDMAKKGIDVFMYDHTIKNLPENHPKFHFFKIGLSGKSGLPNMKTMEEFLSLNKHEKNNEIILKMDIEGWEWEFLNSVDEDVLSKFSQIVFELHELTNVSKSDVMSLALEKLNKSHQLVHIHANNYGTSSILGDTMLPSTLECTYLRRSDHDFVESRRTFPTPLDMPCNQEFSDDIFLGNWNQ